MSTTHQLTQIDVNNGCKILLCVIFLLSFPHKFVASLFGKWLSLEIPLWVRRTSIGQKLWHRHAYHAMHQPCISGLAYIRLWATEMERRLARMLVKKIQSERKSSVEMSAWSNISHTWRAARRQGCLPHGRESRSKHVTLRIWSSDGRAASAVKKTAHCYLYCYFWQH